MKLRTLRRLSWHYPLLALGCLGITAFACAPKQTHSRVHTAAKRISGPKEKKELRVVFAAPQKLATPASQISVVMNQPMRALEEVTQKAPSFVTMSPQVPGRWRWIGTQAILFDPEGSLPLATHFRVEVPAGTKPLHGFALKEPFVFEFDTARPALVDVRPYDPQRTLDRDAVFQLTFNQPIAPEDLTSAIRLSARPFDKENAPLTALDVVVDPPDAKEPTVLRVHAKDRLPKASEITLVVMPELKGKVGPLTSGKREERSFRTDGPFELRRIRCDDPNDRVLTCNPARSTVYAAFSTPIDAKELSEHIRLEPSLPFQVTDGWKDGYQTFSIGLVANWKPSTAYRVHIRKGLTDKYGEVLGRDLQGSFRTGPLASMIGPTFEGTYFLPGAHPFSVQSRNHKKVSLAYVPLNEELVVKMFDPLVLSHYYNAKVEAGEIKRQLDSANTLTVLWGLPGAKKEMISNAVLNQHQVHPIPTGTLIDRKTNTGVFVVAHEYGTLFDPSFDHHIVQVTDISMQAMFSQFGSLLRFTRASTGLPIAGAQVNIYDRSADGQTRAPIPFSTDSNGFVRVPAEKFNPFATVDRENPCNPFVAAPLKGPIVIKTEKDWAFFSLYDNINSRSALPERVEEPTGMFFSERRIYRPGETVHLKGIVRLPARAGIDQHARIPKDAKVHVQLNNATGEVVLDQKIELTRFGTFALDYTIPEAAPLGNMHAKVSLDEQICTLTEMAKFGPKAVTLLKEGTLSFEKDIDIDGHIFQIAEYRANEITVQASPNRAFYMHGDTPSFRIHAESHSGIPLAGKSVTALYWREHTQFRPPHVPRGFSTDYEAFLRVNQKSLKPVPQRREITLDSSGNATLDAVLDPYEPIGAERLVVNVEAAEAGGQPVAANASATLHPGSFYLAISNLMNIVHRETEIKPRVLAVGLTGQLIPHVNVHVELIERARWGDRGRERKEQVVSSCDLATSTNATSCALAFKNSGHFVLKATAADEKGRKVTASQWVYRVPPEEKRFYESGTYRYDLVLIADKDAYHIGDTAKITVQSPFESAEALVTVEGNGIYEHRAVELQGPSPTVDVPVTGDMWPKAGVSVILTERGKTTKDTAVAYRHGWLPLRMTPEDRKLSLAVKAPKELKPGAPVEIAIDVHDPSGRPAAAEITLYAVDEGVLSLSGEKSPDPLAFFAQHRGWLVAPMDSRDQLGSIPTPSVGRRNFAVRDGDAMPVSADPSDFRDFLRSPRRDFRTTAYYNPSLVTDAQGRVKTSFTLPESFSSYRIVALAVGENDMMGSAETNIKTVHEMMLRPIAPRFFRAGDTAYVGAVVSSLLPGRNEFELELRGKGLDATGARKERVTLESGQSKEVRFEVKASRVGKAQLQLIGRSGKTTDSVVIEREVRLPVPPETVALYGETNSEQFEEIASFANLRTDIGGMDIELSNSALVGLSDTVTELLEARYGSTEELVSRLVAILASRDLSKAVGAAPAPGMDRLANETVARIRELQNPVDGSFHDWSGTPRDGVFVTAYALLGLSLAKQKGIAIPDKVIDISTTFLSRYLIEQFDKSKLDEGLGFVMDALVETQIAKPFTLPASRLREMIHTVVQRRTELNVASRAILLHAAHRLGKDVDPADVQAFSAMSAELEAFIRLTGPLGLVVEAMSNEYNPHLDSSTRTTALVLRALLAVNPDHPMSARLSRGLLSTRKGRGWGTTQEKAWALLALGDYKRGQEHTNTGFTAAVSMSDKELGRATFPRGRNSAFHFTAPVSAMTSANTLDFQVDGQGTVFYSARFRYALKNQPTEPLEEGLTIQRSQRVVNFRNIEKAMNEAPGADETTFKEGDLILTDLTLVVPTPRNNVVIEDAIPAGFEPVSGGFATTAQWIAQALKGNRAMDLWGDDVASGLDSAYRNDWYRQELRDDRALFFVHHAAPGLYRFQYLTRAITPGTFQRPPVRAEDMYAPDVYGRSGGSFVRVVAASAK